MHETRIYIAYIRECYYLSILDTNQTILMSAHSISGKIDQLPSMTSITESYNLFIAKKNEGLEIQCQ